MGLTINSGDVLLNMDNTQQQFQKTVTQLSSGLRINSAADDPSGNSIAINLQSKTLGIQQAAQNVQNANNALNVAMGALNEVQTILERMNTLIVESNSDINSSSDLQNIQAEISQLMDEINSIGQKTNFNGLNLLDGQFDTSSGTAASIVQVNSPFGGSPDVSNFTGAPGGGAGPLLANAGIPTIPGFPFIPGLDVLTVTSYSDDPWQPDSGSPLGAPGVTLQFDGYTSDTADAGAPLYQDVSAIQVGIGDQTGIQLQNASGSIDFLSATLANLSANDVGTSIAFFTTEATGPAGGKQLTVNDGGSEGQDVGISLPTINTSALGLDYVSVLAPDTSGTAPGSGGVEQDDGTNASNVMAASYSEIVVGNALTKITTAQAQIGAQVVSLNIDDQNDDTASTNLEASASDITDLNVGQATTQYTQDQILVNVGTSVLAQMESADRTNTALLIQALIA
jgi:flagellin